MRPARRAFLAAGLAVLLLAGAGPVPAGAQPPDSLTFGTLPTARTGTGDLPFWARRRTPVLVAGAALTVGALVASQLLLTAASHRYDDYLATADPVEMQARFADSRRLDHWSNALLVMGEAAAAATLYLAWRSPRGAPEPALTLTATPLPGGAAVRVAWSP
jgi:hypothetical protein